MDLRFLQNPKGLDEEAEKAIAAAQAAAQGDPQGPSNPYAIPVDMSGKLVSPLPTAPAEEALPTEDKNTDVSGPEDFSDGETDDGEATAATEPMKATGPATEYGDLISKLYGSGLGAQALTNAMRSQHNAELVNDMAKAGSIIGSGLAYQKPNTEAIDSLRKGAGQGVQDILTLRKSKDDEVEGAKKLQSLNDDIALNDKNSPVSVAARQLAASLPEFDGKVAPTMTAAALFKLQPMLRSMLFVNFKQKNEEAKKAEKLDAAATKRFDKVNQTISTAFQRSNTAVGKAAGIKRQSEAIEAMLHMRKPEEVTSQEFYELAKSLDSMLSQNSGTASGTKLLIPNTALKTWAGWKSYVSSNPEGAGIGAFVRRLGDTIAREKATAINQIKEAQNEALGSYLDLKESHPETWNRMMRTHHLPTIEEEKAAEEMVGSPTPSASPPPPSRFSPDVIAYAQKHGLTPEQAQKIKDKRMGK